MANNASQHDQLLLSAQIEALLFVHGDSMKFTRLAKLLGVSLDDIAKLLASLKKAYKDAKRGLDLVYNKDTVQLATSSHCADIVEKMIAGDLQEDLSKSSLEVLAIVAYRGPVSRMDIDAIRGVSCAFALRNLMIRGLIERATHPENNRSYLYQVTNDFLTHLGLSHIDQLPDFDKLRTHKKIDAILPVESHSK